MAAHNGFPGIVKAGNGDLLIVYRAGADHLGLDGIIESSRSTDNGVTWADDGVVVDNTGGGDDSRDVALALLADGRIACTYTRSSDDATDFRPYVIFSDDDGATWGSQIAITEGFTGSGTWAFVSAPVVELASGDLVVPLYGRDATAIYYSRLSRSTDGGATWADDGVLAATDSPAAVDHHQEPWITALADGTHLCFLRSTETGNDFEQIYLTRSTDDCETWSVPVHLFPGAARPAALETPNGDIVLMARQAENVDMQVGYVRRCRGNPLDVDSWSDYRLLNPTSGGIFFVYGQWLILEDDSLAAAMSFQSPNGWLYFYRFTEWE